MEEPFPDYEDNIDLSVNDEVNKEQLMDGMKIFDYHGLENFHNYNLNVETSKRLSLNDEDLKAAVSSSDDDGEFVHNTEDK